MKKNLMRMFALLLVAILVTLPLAPTAQAAERVNGIKVTVSLTGTLPKPAEDYTVILERNDRSFPMPKGSEGDRYKLTITGADTEEFPAIDFEKVGIYTYTVWQQPGTNKKCKNYDDTVYYVTIYVTNKEGGGLESTVAIHTDDVDEKVDIKFQNDYVVKELPKDTPQTDDLSNFPLYTGMAIGGVVILTGLFLTRKKKESIDGEEEE